VNLDRQRSIDKIFQDALERPAHDRSMFLDSACAHDPSLRPDVDKLIRAFEAAGSFLELSPANSLVGRTFGSYHLKRLVGSGGMGQVYLASDSKLKREVAVKVLPGEFSRDPERVLRFQREAEVLASLNHPHIAAIYDLVHAGELRFLVLEFVEGETLDNRLARGPIPIDEALQLASQIAEALEAAHEKGIVHRDLKPSNVKITSGNIVKVLDFGLAKALHSAPPDPSSSISPGEGLAITNKGLILGTAAYMSPEQAKGQAVDRRTDIFAFGCVLYEMLAGRPTFAGESAAEILGQVMTSEPDWTHLPAGIPSGIRRLLRRALQKDARQRLGDMRDARLEIEDTEAETRGPRASVPVGSSSAAWIAAAGVVLLAVILAVLMANRLREVPPPEMRLQINTPSTAVPFEFALSPNGQNLVFVASGDGSQRLWLRSLDKTDAEPIPGTEGADLPFWSADSRSIGFFASSKLYRVDISGGVPQPLANVASSARGGAWNADGTILFAPSTASPLLRIDARGGEPVVVTRLDPPRKIGHRFPQFLPDGRHFLFYTTGDPEASGIYLGALDEVEAKRLTPADVAGSYFAPDRVVFIQQGALVTRRLDVTRGELIGDPLTVTERVGYDSNNLGGFSVSSDGLVAYRTGSPVRQQLRWFDKTGKAIGAVGEPDANGLSGPELSPDGRRVAVFRRVQGNTDIYLMDLLRGGRTRFTFDPRPDYFPVWSPDGSQIVFRSDREDHDLYIKPSNGSGTEELLHKKEVEVPQHWSTDGKFLLYFTRDRKTARDLWALPMKGDDRRPHLVANSPYDERIGQFSPNGLWVAYETNESGRFEVVVQSFPEPNGKWQVSIGGGTQPRWRSDGKELYFIAPDGKLMAASVDERSRAGTFEAGTPVPLFPARIAGNIENAARANYAVSPDGRFLIVQDVDEPTSMPITLISNWRGNSRWSK
jgi:serine/threonine protein kinase